MPQKWKTVRIFISSTFHDMHAERDHLVRFVFPELKEKYRKNHVHLIDVDLRQGVTEADARAGKIILTVTIESTIVFKLTGPLLTRIALVRAGKDRRDTHTSP